MTGQAINVVLITFVIVLLFHVATEFVFRKKEKVQSALRSIAMAIVVAALALLFHLNLENVGKMEEVRQELNDIKEISSGMALYKPYEIINKLPENNSFRKLLSREMEKVKTDIEEIGRCEIYQTADEFISSWDVTIGRYSKKTVDVITSIDNIDENPSTQWMLKELGTYDIKVIDNECIFCSIIGEKNGMRALKSGFVLNDSNVLNMANEFFQKLWNESHPPSALPK
ncbi:MAG: hypothetical protein FJY10_05380 [Bacteroidetes bacterium]|nr:hypothetical protein [Bacteroidota bacterium]